MSAETPACHYWPDFRRDSQGWPIVLCGQRHPAAASQLTRSITCKRCIARLQMESGE